MFSSAALSFHQRPLTQSIGRSLRRTALLGCVVAAGVRVALAANEPPPAHFDTSEAETDLKKVQVGEGLKTELFAAEPLLQNPVCISVNDRGDVYVAETHRLKISVFDIWEKKDWQAADAGLRTVADRAAFLAQKFAKEPTTLTKDSEVVRLLQDRDGDGRADTSTVFADGFNEPVSGTGAGLLAWDGAVYYTCIPDLWKLGASTGPGQTAPREKLLTGFGPHIGVSGHDLAGLCVGPDGWLYFSTGDRGLDLTTREGAHLSMPDTGGVLRCRPDGSGMEIYAIGMRNPHDLTFDAYGNLWTDDNDTAGDDPSRVLDLVEGGDYGWRRSYQFMPGFGPWVLENGYEGGIDNTLPYAGIVAQGPAAILYYPGTGLSPRFDGHFFVADYPGGVWAFNVRPKGASYEVVEKEKVLWNLYPSDLDFSPRGGLYVTDMVRWGAGLSQKGRIYRLFDPQAADSAPVREVRDLLAAGMTGRSADELAVLLVHPDFRIRQRAQFALAGRGKEALPLFAKVAAHGPTVFARLHAIWGLGQLGAAAIPSVVPLVADGDFNVRAQAAKTLGDLCRAKADRATARTALLPLLRDPHPRVRLQATIGLSKTGEAADVAAVVEMLRANANEDAFLIHAGVMALTRLADSAALQNLAKNENPVIRRAALLSWRLLQDPKIGQFLDDSDPRLVMEAARAIHDTDMRDLLPALAARVGDQRLPAGVVSRAINAHYRLGQPANAQALAAFAALPAAAPSHRAEALTALATWGVASPEDRVTGFWMPIPSRGSDAAREALRPALPALLRDHPEPILLGALAATRQLEIKGNEAAVSALFSDSHLSSAVRVAALETLAALQASTFADSVAAALDDKDNSIRRAAIRWVGAVNPTAAVPLLEKFLNAEKDLRIRQAILVALGRLPGPAADQSLRQQLDLLLAGKIPAPLQLDVLDAARARVSPEIQECLQRYESSLNKQDPLARYRVTLVGGDAAVGRKIFQEREEVACQRCHSIHGSGGTVGPDLVGVATQHNRDYVLDSIVFPNHNIAANYESLLLTLKDGSILAGQLKGEDPHELKIQSLDGVMSQVPREKIASRMRSPSAMPEGLANLLTLHELRDLVEYISTLK